MTGRLASGLAIGVSAYALYWVIGIIQPQIYRVTFLMMTLTLSFLLFPGSRASRARVSVVDWLLLGTTVVALAWPIVNFWEFVYRAATPTGLDLTLGVVTIGLVLEATRRTVGWILPATALGFLVYGYLGPLLGLVGLGLIAHRGYSVARLVGTLYMTLEGIFGVPLDVAATYIVLFTIYGAILQHSGAGQFFINWAMAAMGRSGGGSGPGRAIALSGFLLGTVSGSGVATTVTLGAVGWPLLRRAGYPADVGAGIPVGRRDRRHHGATHLGAAAFLIAEFLKISYLQVITMAAIPAMLYYFSILLMIEADSRRMGTRAVDVDLPTLGTLTPALGVPLRVARRHRRAARHGDDAVPRGVPGDGGRRRAQLPAFRACAVAHPAARRPGSGRPRRAHGRRHDRDGRHHRRRRDADRAGAENRRHHRGAGRRQHLLHGHLRGSRRLDARAGRARHRLLHHRGRHDRAALTLVGIPTVAAHMFIFYYAVLSEVSPPTALSPFAAAAITGGNPFRTMMLTWKYTLPAFLVPFMFTLSHEGLGVLLQAPGLDVNPRDADGDGRHRGAGDGLGRMARGRSEPR